MPAKFTALLLGTANRNMVIKCLEPERLLIFFFSFWRRGRGYKSISNIFSAIHNSFVEQYVKLREKRFFHSSNGTTYLDKTNNACSKKKKKTFLKFTYN
jgi:hypothetical protein